MIKPLFNNVILIKQEKEKQTSSGIIVSTKETSTPSIGIVYASGDECQNHFKEKDKVVFKEYSGTRVMYDNEEYIVIDEKDILAVIK